MDMRSSGIIGYDRDVEGRPVHNGDITYTGSLYVTEAQGTEGPL